LQWLVAGRFVASRGIAILSNLDMQQCPKMFCNFVQKVLAKNTYKNSRSTKVYSKYSVTVNTKPVPLSPTNLTATSSGYNSAKLSWKSVSGASGYELYRSTSSNGTYSKVKTTSSISYTNTNLKTGNTYYYKVRAYKTISSKNIYGKFSTISSVKPIPSTPSDLKASYESDRSIKISWGTIKGASGYRIYRATSYSGDYSYLKTTTSTSYLDTEIINGSTYYYKVRAFHTEGTVKVYSKYTKVVEITVPKFDYLAASKNIVGEFTDLGDGIIATLTNNNRYPVYLAATVVFYDEAGQMLDESTEYNPYFEPGKQCVMYFYGPTDTDYNYISYSSYKIVYSIDSTEYTASNVSDIKIMSNRGSDNVMVEVSNIGSKTSDYTQIGIIFYKDGKVIAYDYNYAECQNPGSIDYLAFSLPYDEDYNTIQIDSYQIYINYSFSYEW
ncbi:MAG: fibronectin type III domain-containing protein, partial [Herbinix sp.]|nr:fibronectin type III domain-containing protein [Herbinix sp.]